jgi:SNF2 family DNA or RNA helicase
LDGTSLLAPPSSHRVLVFAQFKGLLDLVESDVIAPMGVSYLRLDGRQAFHIS